MMRTHTCGELRLADVGKDVVLTGWVYSVREHGRITFIDLWDRYGITQVVLSEDLVDLIKPKGGLHKGSVLKVEGRVVKRTTPNPELPTGEIEVNCSSVEVLSSSDPLPMEPGDPNNTDLTRLKYRYLDLRRPEMMRNIILRSKITNHIREFLYSQGFIEVETPVLGKSTPEGARDYLVPSRVHKGKFYALPQSPQLFKQLLMVSGVDRYFQIARCFRDEDLRADRQPEFTQVDLEMSFVDEEDIMSVVEGMLAHVFDKVLGVKLSRPFPRMTYDEAVNTYGTDKPDLRYGLPLRDLTQVFRESGFKILSEAPVVKGIVVGPSEGTPEVEYSRKKVDELVSRVSRFGVKGIVYLKLKDEGLIGPMSKHVKDVEDRLIETLHMKPGDSLFIIGGEPSVVNWGLGEVRKILAGELSLTSPDEFRFVWVVDFPMFEYDEEEQRYKTVHHPFTQPKIRSFDELKDKENCKARAYDIVLNGEEVGGGSIRIHDREMQKRVFDEIGISEEQARDKFGFLLEAFRYGVPPHGGIALGLDRLVAIMLKIPGYDIREVIAFPKTKMAEDPLTGAPSEVSEEQLKELGIRIDEES